MPAYASVTSRPQAPYRLFPGCSWTVFNKNCTSTHGTRTGPVRRRANFASPYGARGVLMHAWQVYGPSAGLEIIKTHEQPERGSSYLYLSASLPFATLVGLARAPYGSRRIWTILKIPVWGPHDARTTNARGPCGVMRIIRSNHKYTVTSSRTGPVAWLWPREQHHVKFLWALHSASRARNRTGAKIVWSPWLDVTEA